MLPSDFFLNQGYQVFKNAIPNDLVSDYLRNFEIIKHRKTFLYYSQSIHRWIRPKLSENGFLVNSILNPSLQVQAPRFAKSVKNIIYSTAVYDALCAVSTGFYDFISGRIWPSISQPVLLITLTHGI